MHLEKYPTLELLCINGKITSVFHLLSSLHGSKDVGNVNRNSKDGTQKHISFCEFQGYKLT